MDEWMTNDLRRIDENETLEMKIEWINDHVCHNIYEEIF